MKRWLLAALAVLSIAGPLRAQSLGEVAEQEKAKKKDPKAKTYTEDDLKKYQPPPKPKASPTPTPGALPAYRRPQPRGQGTPPPAQGGAESGSATEVEQGSSEDPAAQTPTSEAAWRDRAQQARKLIATAEKRVADLEARLATLRSPQRQPNPMDANQQDPDHLLTPDPKRIALENELAAARADLAKAQQALADLEESARQKNVPPGWLRD